MLYIFEAEKSAFSSAVSICMYWSRRLKQHAHPWRVERFCKQCHIFLKKYICFVQLTLHDIAIMSHMWVWYFGKVTF